MAEKLTPYGKKIQKRLIDRGMTQAELAEQLGCRPSYLCNILHGNRSGRRYWEKIASILDVDPVA